MCQSKMTRRIGLLENDDISDRIYKFLFSGLQRCFRLYSHNVSDELLLVSGPSCLSGASLLPAAEKSTRRMVASRGLLRLTDSDHSRSCGHANVPENGQVVSTCQNLVIRSKDFLIGRGLIHEVQICLTDQKGWSSSN